MVPAIVGGEVMLDPVDDEPSVGDAVGIAADDRAEVRVRRLLSVEVIEAKHDVGHRAVRSGVTIDVMMPPYEIARTSMP